MKASGSETSQEKTSRPQSQTSSRSRFQAFSKKLGTGKKFVSALLQNRMRIRVVDHRGVDVTPKPLYHPMFNRIEDNQITAFETIGLSQAESTAQLALLSSTYSTFKSSSSVLTRSCSYLTEETQIESLLSTQLSGALPHEEDKAPPQFYLPRHESGVFYVRPETITIILRETETVIFFELLPLTADVNTPEGQAVKQANDRYNFLKSIPAVMRKCMDAETQTIDVITKSRGTYLGQKSRQNRGMYVNNWVIYDTYAAPDLMMESNGLLVVRRKESILQMAEAQELQNKLPKYELYAPLQRLSDQLKQLSHNPSFLNAAKIIERIISNNVFIDAQKRFKGVVQQDPCSLDLEFNYTLDLLWIHNNEMSQGRPVSSFCWNPSNNNVLAVGYGAKADSEKKDGLILIWCAKNPAQPGRWYLFNSPISNFEWSRDRPNLLAIGFYDGVVRVIDVSKPSLNVIRESTRAISSACEPHWNVQWWPGDEQFDFQEQIYTCNQDGSVYRYPMSENFLPSKMIQISRIENEVPGVQRTDHCITYDILISRNPGALILRRHPTQNTVYYVGTDEGAIYQCSTNYLYQHIDSFLAHDGPIYAMEFSPFCSKLFLTCGADWCTRIWAEGITEPLITLSTTMACVRYATWCPTYSTIIASIINNEICIWNIKRKTYMPTSITTSPNSALLVKLEFTSNGKQIVAADLEGAIYVYNLEGIPFPPYNQQEVLIESVYKALVTKPALLRKLKKFGPPF